MPRIVCTPENMRYKLHSLPKSDAERLALLGDTELVSILRYVEEHSDFANYMGSAIRDSFDAVVDFPNTGRRHISDSEVQNNEKTYVGTRVEKRLQALLGAASRGKVMDLSLGGVENDVKFSMSRFGGWMIPVEAVQPTKPTGHLCLCVFADDRTLTPKYDTILIRASKDRVNPGVNQDKKSTFKASAILQDGVLIYARQNYRSSILAHFTAPEVEKLFTMDGNRRLVTAIQLLDQKRIPVSLHPSDILMLARGARADAFIDAITPELDNLGIKWARIADGSLRISPALQPE